MHRGLVLGEGCFQLSPLRALQLQVGRQLVDLLGLFEVECVVRCVCDKEEVVSLYYIALNVQYGAFMQHI